MPDWKSRARVPVLHFAASEVGDLEKASSGQASVSLSDNEGVVLNKLLGSL